MAALLCLRFPPFLKLRNEEGSRKTKHTLLIKLNHFSLRCEESVILSLEEILPALDVYQMFLAHLLVLGSVLGSGETKGMRQEPRFSSQRGGEGRPIYMWSPYSKV